MHRWENFKTANRLKRANYWLQILLILAFIAGLNHLALNHFQRFDLSSDHRFALSPETRAYLEEIREPVDIIVTIPENSPREEEQVLFRYVDQLLQEYTYQGRRGGEYLIRVEFVDIYKDLDRAEALAREYGMDQVNAVLVTSGGRKRLIRADELAEFDNREPVAFTGEAAITSALMEVTQESSPKIYFLTGHQETSPDDPGPQSGLSQISRELQMRNFDIQQLDLTRVPEIPADAAVLVVGDPKGPLLPSEIDKIRSYLFEDAGRVIIWARPGIQTGLESLLSEWGLALTDQMVVEPSPGFRESTGNILIRNFGEHPITDPLIQNQTFVVSGIPRPILPKPPVPADERLHFVPLFATSADSWAESAYQAPGKPEFNPETDIQGPIPVAVATERRASSQLGIKVQGGRLVVFGTPDLFSNQKVSSLGNVSLLFNTINWLLDRDRMLVIPPRPLESYKLTVSQDQFKQIGMLFLIVPGALALLGFMVYWVRQS